jgi:hypothetical protein
MLRSGTSEQGTQHCITAQLLLLLTPLPRPPLLLLMPTLLFLTPTPLVLTPTLLPILPLIALSLIPLKLLQGPLLLPDCHPHELLLGDEYRLQLFLAHLGVRRVRRAYQGLLAVRRALVRQRWREHPAVGARGGRARRLHARRRARGAGLPRRRGVGGRGSGRGGLRAASRGRLAQLGPQLSQALQHGGVPSWTGAAVCLHGGVPIRTTGQVPEKGRQSTHMLVHEL